MASITVIDNNTYKNELAELTGSLLFPGDYYETGRYVDKKKLRKNLPVTLPKGSRILGVLVHTTNSNGFKNISNKLVPYSTPVCGDMSWDGAYRKHYPEMGFTMTAMDFPVGDAIVIVSKL